MRVKVGKAGCARAPACHWAELACAERDGAGAEKGGEAVKAARRRERKLLCASAVRCAELRMQAANEG